MLKLIPDWRSAWKYLSVKFSLIWAALAAAWLLMGDAGQATMLSWLPFGLGGKGPEITVLIAFLSITWSRLKAQPALDAKRGESTVDTYPTAHHVDQAAASVAAEPADEWTTKLRQGLDRGYQPKPGQGKPLPPPGPLGGGGPGDAPK
jgi:hypothetical protein